MFVKNNNILNFTYIIYDILYNFELYKIMVDESSPQRLLTVKIQNMYLTTYTQ